MATFADVKLATLALTVTLTLMNAGLILVRMVEHVLTESMATYVNVQHLILDLHVAGHNRVS